MQPNNIHYMYTLFFNLVMIFQASTKYLQVLGHTDRKSKKPNDKEKHSTKCVKK